MCCVDLIRSTHVYDTTYTQGSHCGAFRSDQLLSEVLHNALIAYSGTVVLYVHGSVQFEHEYSLVTDKTSI